jgi:hypothetical protein
MTDSFNGNFTQGMCGTLNDFIALTLGNFKRQLMLISYGRIQIVVLLENKTEEGVDF